MLKGMQPNYRFPSQPPQGWQEQAPSSLLTAWVSGSPGAPGSCSVNIEEVSQILAAESPLSGHRQYDGRERSFLSTRVGFSPGHFPPRLIQVLYLIQGHQGPTAELSPGIPRGGGWGGSKSINQNRFLNEWGKRVRPFRFSLESAFPRAHAQPSSDM